MRGGDQLAPPPAREDPVSQDRDATWRHFDNSVNAVSFGFVATAILISMFLVMAIFERFLRPRSSSSPPPASSATRADLEAAHSHVSFNPKLGHFPSPKRGVYSKEISVLMPGDEMPRFIAQPCPPQRALRPLHHHTQHLGFVSSSTTATRALTLS